MLLQMLRFCLVVQMCKVVGHCSVLLRLGLSGGKGSNVAAKAWQNVAGLERLEREADFTHLVSL
jgi:hypothetical protein